MRSILITLAIFLLSLSAGAQNLMNLGDTRGIAQLRMGFEPTIVVGAGYIHIFSTERINRKIGVFGELSSPVIKLFGPDNYEVKAGAMIPVVQTRCLGITYALNASTGHVHTENFDSQKLAFSNKILIGYFGTKGYLAVSGEYEKNIANKITQSDYYLENIYPEARSGWYKGTGGYFQLGFEIGHTFSQRFDLNFDLKVPSSEKFNGYQGSPGHANITLAYRIF